MKRYAQDYVSSCVICEERKYPKRKKQLRVISYLFGERVSEDCCIYLCILVVSEYFTKFCKICPLQDMEAETVTGCPLELHFDQSRQFEIQLFMRCANCAMCKLLQIIENTGNYIPPTVIQDASEPNYQKNAIKVHFSAPHRLRQVYRCRWNSFSLLQYSP